MQNSFFVGGALFAVMRAGSEWLKGHHSISAPLAYEGTTIERTIGVKYNPPDGSTIHIRLQTYDLRLLGRETDLTGSIQLFRK